MTDLERRALLGDEQAQEECARQGILLPCPFCGGKAIIKANISSYGKSYAVRCENKCAVTCGHFITLETEWRTTTEKEAFERWNTRPVLPIGRCKACENWCTGTTLGMKCACQELSNAGDNGMVFTSPYDFCKRFKPKEGEENAAD